MSLSSIKSQLHVFLYFLTLAQAILLHPSDKNALSDIYRGFGFRRSLPSNPCTSMEEISCERRFVNSSYTMRVTAIVVESRGLKGQLSPAVGELSELKQLSLRDNKLYGQIPPEIVNCKKLKALILGKNRFSGDIGSVGLSSLTGLRVLDLSSNEFSGSLEFLKSLHDLEKVNLSDNMFSGKLNLDGFQNLRFLNLSGNDFLKGESLSTDEEYPNRYVFAETSSSPPSTAAAPTKTKHKSTRKKIGETILKVLVGILLGCVSGAVFSVIIKTVAYVIRGRKRKETSLTIFSPTIKKPEELAFLEKEDGLESFEIIGSGGCGVVYKAILPGNNGAEIAIKKIVPIRDGDDDPTSSAEDGKKMRQIRSEIQTVGQVRHKNLLPLLAHLPRPNCHYLVYEYMKNGSLQEYLQLVSEGRRELDWWARYRIAVGVAAGLEYLHMNHSPSIIHRDLKPANVLLDDEMEARITDFGLATVVPDSQTHITTSNIAGTVGYIAPEYYQTFKFTDKCDVFSFGVMLGVLMTGKFPSDEFFQHTEEMSLVHWVRSLMTSEEPEKAIDAKLLGNGFEESMLLVLKVACFCTLDNPKERPNSKDVRVMLSQINH